MPKSNWAILSLLVFVTVLLGACAPATTLQQLARQPIPLAPSLASTYQPTADITQLAAAATMTDKAKQIFYSTQPEIDTDRATFEQHCQAPVSSNTVELGCYTSDNRIYILAINQPQLSTEMAVTAAHEMLHAAYGQLSTAERATINSEVEAAVTQLHNPDLNQELRAYRVLEPGQRDNELHSLLGTEYAPLSPQLEQYYSQYFTNRATVVADWQQFNQVFTQIQNTVETLRTQIVRLRTQLNAYRRRGNRATYNTLVSQLNSLVKQYNQAIAQYNALSRSLMGQESPEPSQ